MMRYSPKAISLAIERGIRERLVYHPIYAPVRRTDTKRAVEYRLLPELTVIPGLLACAVVREYGLSSNFVEPESTLFYPKCYP